MRPRTSMQYSDPRALLILPHAIVFCRMSPELNCVDKANKNWLLWQRPLKDQKTNFRLIIYSYSSTDPENLAKIGPAV